MAAPPNPSTSSYATDGPISYYTLLQNRLASFLIDFTNAVEFHCDPAVKSKLEDLKNKKISSKDFAGDIIRFIAEKGSRHSHAMFDDYLPLLFCLLERRQENGEQSSVTFSNSEVANLLIVESRLHQAQDCTLQGLQQARADILQRMNDEALSQEFEGMAAAFAEEMLTLPLRHSKLQVILSTLLTKNVLRNWKFEIVYSPPAWKPVHSWLFHWIW